MPSAIKEKDKIGTRCVTHRSGVIEFRLSRSFEGHSMPVKNKKKKKKKSSSSRGGVERAIAVVAMEEWKG